MRFVSAGSNNAAAENFRNDLGGFAGAVNAIVGELIGRQALGIECAKAGFIAEKRAPGHGHATREENVDGGDQPEDGSVRSAKEIRAAGLRVGSTAESEDGGFFVFGGTAHGGAELIGFDLAESRLAEALEDLRDFQASRFFNALIEIDKAPGELTREERADGGFAGAHEPGEAQDRDTGLRPARKRSGRHVIFARILVALQNANCTTVGGELDLRETLTDGAKEAFGELGSEALDAVRIGLEEGGGAVVHGAQGGLGVEVEGIGTGEADFDETLAALHGVQTGADEIAVEENVAGSCEDADIIKRRLKDLSSAADGFEIQLAGTLRADQRAFRRADDDVAGNFLEVDVALDAFQSHVAHDLLDIDEAGFGLQLQFGFFGHGELEVGFEFQRLGGGVQNVGGDIDAVADLLHFKANLVRELAGGDVHLGILGRLYFDAAVGDVVNHHDGPALYGKMLFEMIAGSARGDTGAEKNYGPGDGQNTSLNALKTHVN